jgi:hypothetical protein
VYDGPMAISPKAWAETFTAELSVDGEPVPIERVIARHMNALGELRSLGLTWRGIAGLLVRAGARRGDGKLISADQIRVSYARLARSRSEPGRSIKRRRIPIEAPPLMAAQPEEPLALAAPVDEQRPVTSDPGQLSGDGSKDVSSSELESALLRLEKLTTKRSR